MKNFRINILAIILLTVISGIFFYRTLLSNMVPVPADALVGLYHPWRDSYAEEYPRGVPFKNYLITDPVRQQIPWRKLVVDSWKNDTMPGWNRYSFSGTGLIGNIQSAPLYPLNLIFLLTDFITAWAVLIVLQPLLSSIFFYLYARQKQFSVPASLFGSVAWAFSGFSIAWLTWGTIDHVVLWLPCALFLLEKLHDSVKKHSSKPYFLSFLLGAVLILSFLAGHAQISLYVDLLVISYAFWISRDLSRSNRIRFAAYVTAAVTFCFIGLIPQLYPFMTDFFNSARSVAFSSYRAPGWFIPWQNLVQFIAPDYFGNPATLNYFGIWNYGEFLGYVGIIPLMFAALAIFQKNKLSRLFLFIIGISFLFAVANPLATIPFILQIPVLSSMQPTRLIVLIDFSLVVLATIGFDEWVKGSKKNIGSVVIITGLLLGILWIIPTAREIFIHNEQDRLQSVISLRNLVIPSLIFISFIIFTVLSTYSDKIKLRRPILGLFIILVTIIDLFRMGWKYTPFVDRRYFFPETELTKFLTSEKKPFRVLAVDKRIFPPNTASYYGIETADGYDSVYSARYEQFFAAAARNKPDINPPYGFNRILSSDTPESPLWSIANVKFVLSLSDISVKQFQKVGVFGEVRVYRNTAVSSRFYLAEYIERQTSSNEIIKALYDPAFQPDSTAVVERDLGVTNTPRISGEEIQISEYGSNRIKLNVKTVYRRLLVIGIPYTTGWTARINGIKIDILPTNFVFMGIVVPEGNNFIELTYSPYTLFYE